METAALEEGLQAFTANAQKVAKVIKCGVRCLNMGLGRVEGLTYGPHGYPEVYVPWPSVLGTKEDGYHGGERNPLVSLRQAVCIHGRVFMTGEQTRDQEKCFSAL